MNGNPGRKADKRVLVPLRDPDNLALVRLGALIAKERGAGLLILHVIEVPLVLPPKSIRFDDVEARVKALRKLRELAGDLGVEVSLMVKIAHKVYEAIHETMEEGKLEALILAWHGKHLGGGGHMFGTGLDFLVQVAKCDVIVLKGMGMDEKPKRLTVLSGHAWHTTHAAEVAALLAREHEAEVTVLSVVRRKALEESTVAYGRRLMGVLEERGVPSSHEIVHSRSIMRAAVEQASKSDLLILGANPRRAFRRFHFGPLEDKLAKRVGTPVLMFRKAAEAKANH